MNWLIPSVIHDPKIHFEYSTSRVSKCHKPKPDSWPTKIYEHLRDEGPMMCKHIAKDLNIGEGRVYSCLAVLQRQERVKVVKRHGLAVYEVVL
jgi:hypothetical protein